MILCQTQHFSPSKGRWTARERGSKGKKLVEMVQRAVSREELWIQSPYEKRGKFSQ